MPGLVAAAGEPGGIRTHDQRIKSPLLYQLSYRPGRLAPAQPVLPSKRYFAAPRRGRLLGRLGGSFRDFDRFFGHRQPEDFLAVVEALHDQPLGIAALGAQLAQRLADHLTGI